MKRRMLGFLLATIVAIPVLAGTRTLVRLEGWIVDSHCGAKNANAESTEDTLSCHKDGAKLVFIAADGTSYAIENQERALLHVGQKIAVFGTVDKERNLKVGSYIGSDKGPVKEPKKPDPEPRED